MTQKKTALITTKKGEHGYLVLNSEKIKESTGTETKPRSLPLTSKRTSTVSLIIDFSRKSNGNHQLNPAIGRKTCYTIKSDELSGVQLPRTQAHRATSLIPQKESVLHGLN